MIFYQQKQSLPLLVGSKQSRNKHRDNLAASCWPFTVACAVSVSQYALLIIHWSYISPFDANVGTRMGAPAQ
jgi:hypothetical protein